MKTNLHMASTHSFLYDINFLSSPTKPNQTPLFHHSHRRRRITTTAAASIGRRSSLLNTTISIAAIVPTKPATALELRLTVPDQTLEEAESGILSHARSLVKVKDLLEGESWREAQKSLRKSSSLLKQDIYTIILGKPPDERPLLRKLYSDLFNAVTRLDYAARDKDRISVWDYYNTIVLSLDDILSRIL